MRKKNEVMEWVFSRNRGKKDDYWTMQNDFFNRKVEEKEKKGLWGFYRWTNFEIKWRKKKSKEPYFENMYR